LRSYFVICECKWKPKQPLAPAAAEACSFIHSLDFKGRWGQP